VQRRDPTNRNRIRGCRGWTSGHVTAKSISVKSRGSKSGGCALKASGLTSGDLHRVPEPGLRESRGPPTAVQKSAEGIVGGGNEPEAARGEPRRPHPTEGPNGAPARRRG